jgi:lipoate synthase
MVEAPLEFIRPREPKPPWLKVRAPGSENYLKLKGVMKELKLHTVCEEARCPNIGECWHHGTATFMILGDVCTRACAYCAVAHGKPNELDLAEPARVADAIERMALRHAVITSVDRDDLADGGAFIFAETIRRTRERVPGCRIEVLIPDFQGLEFSLRTGSITTSKRCRGCTGWHAPAANTRGRWSCSIVRGVTVRRSRPRQASWSASAKRWTKWSPCSTISARWAYRF